MIECDLQPLPEFSSMPSKKTKFGRYHNSCFWDIKKYGSQKWVIAAYIEVKDQAIFEVMDHNEIIDQCYEFLNKVPPKKKWAKKNPKPKYGVLNPYQNKIVTKNGQKIISSLFTVENRKSKDFWGKGKSV